jgi:hypothetical protein
LKIINIIFKTFFFENAATLQAQARLGPVAATSWIDDWTTDGYTVLPLGTLSFAHEWESK